MTTADWQEHACKCREVALTMDDPVARRVLLEAADDYLALAANENRVRQIIVPVYQAMTGQGLASCQAR